MSTNNTKPEGKEQTFIETIGGVEYICTHDIKEGDEVLSYPQAITNYERGLRFKLEKIHEHIYHDAPNEKYYFADLRYIEHPLMPELVGRLFTNWPLQNCFKILSPSDHTAPQEEEELRNRAESYATELVRIVICDEVEEDIASDDEVIEKYKDEWSIAADAYLAGAKGKTAKDLRNNH